MVTLAVCIAFTVGTFVGAAVVCLVASGHVEDNEVEPVSLDREGVPRRDRKLTCEEVRPALKIIKGGVGASGLEVRGSGVA